MRYQTIIASMLTALLGAACVGDVEDGGDGGSGSGSGSGSNAKAEFDSIIAPLLTAQCASCHVGPNTSPTNMFLGEDGLSSYYSQIQKDRGVNGNWDPAQATLLTKGLHTGPAFTAADAAKISKWLTDERTARGSGGGVDPGGNGSGSGSGSGSAGLTSARGAAMAFAACMSVSETEYTATQAYQVANMNSNNGRCTSCHNGSAGGVNFTNTNAYKDMFSKWQQELTFYGIFQPAAPAAAGGNYTIAAAEAKLCNKGTEKQNNLGTHPQYDCKQNNSTALNNLKTFITQVQAKVGTAACPTPAFKPYGI
jgi:hypothetical protein